MKSLPSKTERQLPHHRIPPLESRAQVEQSNTDEILSETLPSDQPGSENAPPENQDEQGAASSCLLTEQPDQGARSRRGKSRWG